MFDLEDLGAGLKSIGLMIFECAIVLIALEFVINVGGIISKRVDALAVKAEELLYIESKEGTISDDVDSVVALVDGKAYTLDELSNLKDVPMTLSVIVMYNDGTIEQKSAFVQHNGDSINYVNNAEGIINLPRSKE